MGASSRYHPSAAFQGAFNAIALWPVLLAAFITLCLAPASASPMEPEPDISYENLVFKKKPGVSEAAIRSILAGESVNGSSMISSDLRLGTVTLEEMTDEAAQNLGMRAQQATRKRLFGEQPEVPETDQEIRERGRRERIRRAIERLQASGLVEYAEPDYLLELQAVPNDPLYPEMYGLQQINAPAAWDIRTDASSVVVAVVDSGINYNHPDIRPNIWRNPGEIPGNGIDDDGNGFIDDIHGADFVNNDSNPMDDNNHGTHVAGTIGAKGNNGIGITGVAWSAQLMAVKAFDEYGRGLTSRSILALDYARRNGAQIINASWGGSFYSQGIRDMMETLRQEDIIVVAASGNSNRNVDNSPHYPSNYLSNNVVSIGATNDKAGIAAFSNFGMLTDLFAPGDFILSTIASNQYEQFRGTSMATPHVTGALALLKAHFPTESAQQLINRLHRSATYANIYNGKALTGGRLNLFGAFSASNTPINNTFDERLTVTTPSAKLRTTFHGASIQAGEPLHAGVMCEGTVWYSWRPNRDTPAKVSTKRSIGDTVVAVYTGSTLTNLTLVAANDDANGTSQAEVSFMGAKNTNYVIAVGLKAGTTDRSTNVEIEMTSFPSNDDYANAQDLGGDYDVSVDASSVGASLETEEPSTFVLTGRTYSFGATVWYRWVAPETRYVECFTLNTDYDTTLSVHTGATMATSQRIAFNDDANRNTQDSRVGFKATMGQVYHIGVGGYIAHTGKFRLRVVSDTENRAPTGTIQATPVSLTEPLKISFAVPDAADVDGSIKGYRWDFGDGSPTKTGRNQTHNYPAPGVYLVELVITDNEDKEAIIETSVRVASSGLHITSGLTHYYRFDTQLSLSPTSNYVTNEVIGGPISGSGDDLEFSLELGPRSQIYTPGRFSFGAARFGTTAPNGWGRATVYRPGGRNISYFVPRVKTVAFWVSVDQFAEGRTTADLVAVGENRMVFVQNGTLRYTERADTTAKTIQGNGFQLNRWHHVTISYDLDRMKLYLDGNLVANQVYTDDMQFPDYGTWVFANAYSPNYLIGSLDEIYIFDRALSDVEVKLIMNQGLNAPSSASATALSGQEVQLNWSDSSTNESGFRIERKMGSEKVFTEIASLPAGTTSFLDSTTTPLTSVSYRVIAFHEGTQSGPSIVVTLTTPAPIVGNLLQNPGLEAGVFQPWTRTAGGNVALTTSTVQSGTYALQHTGRTSASSRIRVNILNSLLLNGSGGYQIGAWVHLTTPSPVTVRLNYRDGTTFRNAEVTAQGNAGWTWIEGEVTTNWTVLNEAYFEVLPTGHAGNYVIDDASMEKLSFDGSIGSPTNLTLSNNKVAENQPIGKFVGQIYTTDPDGGDTHTYELLGTDAAQFSIVGDELRTAAVFDHGQKSSYSVTIRTTDSGGATFSKALTISVLNASFPITTLPNPVIWHRYEGNATDSSGNGNHGTVRGYSTYPTTAKEGDQAIQMRGMRNWIEMNVPGVKTAFAERTLALWIRPTITSGTQVIYEQGNSTGFGLRIRNGLLEAVAAQGSSKTLISVPFTSLQWNHVAVRYHHGLLSLFLNGALVETADSRLLSINAHNTLGCIGGRLSGDPFGGLSDGDLYNGSIDDLRVFDVGLPDSLIAEIGGFALPPPPPPSDEPFEIIQFDSLAGTDYVTSSKGLARTWTLTGSIARVAFSDTSPLSPSSAYFGPQFFGAASSSITGSGTASATGASAAVQNRNAPFRDRVNLTYSLANTSTAAKTVSAGGFIVFRSANPFSVNADDVFSASITGSSGFSQVGRWVVRTGSGAYYVSNETLRVGSLVRSSGITSTTWALLSTGATDYYQSYGSFGSLSLTGLTGAGIYYEGLRSNVSSTSMVGSGFRLDQFRLMSDSPTDDSGTDGSILVADVPYQTWSDTVNWGSISPSERGPNDDPDGDGYTNFLERALNGDLGGADQNLVPMEMETLPDGRLRLTFWYEKGVPSLNYQVVGSVDLNTWTTTGVAPEVYDEASGMYCQQWTLPFGAAGGFGRLQISQP